MGRFAYEMGLSSKQLRAIDVLLTSRTIVTAAKRAKVARTTLFRWLQEPEFRAELKRAQRSAVDQNVRGVASMAGEAIRTLVKLMRESSDQSIRLAAAQEALERLFDADLVMRSDEGGNAQEVPAGGDGPG